MAIGKLLPSKLYDIAIDNLPDNKSKLFLALVSPLVQAITTRRVNYLAREHQMLLDTHASMFMP